MALSEDKKLEILNDHYKDTFSHILNYLKKRDRLFLYLLLVLTVMFLQVVSPSESDAVISKFISKYVGDVTINTSFIRGMVWFILLSLTIRYYQTTVLIERQYAYLRKLGEELTDFCSSAIAFTREGKSYLENYPKLSDWAHTLYTWVFPALLLIFITAKIWIEYQRSLAWVISLVFCLMVWVTTYLYLFFRFQQKSSDGDDG